MNRMMNRMHVRSRLGLLLFIALLAGCAGLPMAEGDGAPGSPDSAAPAFQWPEPSAAFREAFDPEAPFPVDAVLQRGVLANGLTYYVAANDDPPERVLFTLVVDAGAVDEDDDQLGVAHFLEHMLFNGTERFSPKELRDYFAANGMTLGQHLNAGTGYEQTSYFINVDTAQEGMVETAFDLMEDWMAGALIEPAEVDKEKGVVEEEWRLISQNARGRIREQVLQDLLAGSRYAERNIIGDMDVIRGLTAETVRRFYEDWYRPDLMTLLIIGDIDPAYAETQIRTRFAALQGPAEARAAVEPVLSAQPGLRIKVLSDPELPEVSFSLLQLVEERAWRTLQDYRPFLIDLLATRMLNARLQEIERDPDSEFQFARVSFESPGIGGASIGSIDAWLNEERIMPGITSVMTELHRVRTHGFTASELQRAQRNLLADVQDRYEARATRTHRQIEGAVQGHLGTGFPLMDIAFEFDLTKHYLPSIALAETNAVVERFLDVDNRLVFLTAPDKTELALPHPDDLRATLEQVTSLTLAPYEDADVSQALLDAIPPPAEAISETWDERLELAVLTYDNGATAWLKPTDLRDNEVLLQITSPGGLSQVTDDEYFAAMFAASTAQESGAGPFDVNSLERLLAGQTVYFWPYIGDQDEGFNGDAATDDLETLFQLAHLHITQPRMDERAFRNVVDDWRVNMRNRDLDPSFAFNQRIRTVLYGDALRYRDIELQDLEAIDFATVQRIYAERLGALDAPVLILVGDFELAAAKRLASTYIGSLPTRTPAEERLDLSVPARSGPLQERVYQGQESLVVAGLLQVNETEAVADLSREDALALEALAKIMDTRLQWQLREELGGTYSSFIDIRTQREGRASVSLRLLFHTNEDQLDALLATSRAIMRDILAQGVSADEAAAAKTQLHNDLETQQEFNHYWLTAIWEEVTRADGHADHIGRGQERIDSLTRDQINALAPLALTVDQLIEVVLLPEASDPAQ